MCRSSPARRRDLSSYRSCTNTSQRLVFSLLFVACALATVLLIYILFKRGKLATLVQLWDVGKFKASAFSLVCSKLA